MYVHCHGLLIKSHVLCGTHVRICLYIIHIQVVYCEVYLCKLDAWGELRSFWETLYRYHLWVSLWVLMNVFRIYIAHNTVMGQIHAGCIRHCLSNPLEGVECWNHGSIHSTMVLVPCEPCLHSFFDGCGAVWTMKCVHVPTYTPLLIGIQNVYSSNHTCCVSHIRICLYM